MIPVKSKSEVTQLLSSDLQTIRSCIRGAWDSYQQLYSPALRARHTPLSRATLVHDEMVQQAEKEFDGRTGVVMQRIQRMFVVSFGPHLVIRFKKFDDTFRVSNIPTEQSMSFINQQLELPGVERATKLHAGYRLNSLETALEGVYLVCPRGHGHEWILDLDDLDAAADNVVTFPTKPGTPPAGFKLKLVPKEKEGTDDQG